MEVSNKKPQNPLGLSLDFMFGRGYLWAERQRISDWIALESLRMEIPDLKFPFDARGGLNRFRHTRCLVREVEFAISEVGLGDLLTEAASHLDGFEELQVRFLEDAAHISMRLNTLGTDSYLSFRAALIPPEPARADEVHLSLYDYRAFGPLPYPARLVVHELLTSLLNTPVFRSPGRGKSFTVGIAGDIVSFRPLKLLFLHIFPKVGWKLPNLSGVVLESARIRPGVLTIRAVDDDPQSGSTGRGAEFELATSKEGARALAAYEAKELFSHADQALFEGNIRQALSLLSNYRDVYGLHPALVARLLDCLVADASPSNLAEAESIRRELIAEDPKSLQAHLVAPLVALARRRDEEAREAFSELAARLQQMRQTRDWILSELALAALLADDDPDEAATRLRQVLKRDPRNRAALEALRKVYERIDERAGLEETLKRLTGVYTDRETLKKTYLELAQHLMEREGDLAEARMYLEKVLRLDATELEALNALGESYVLGGEPLRALKAFGSAARTADAEGKARLASRLHFKVGELWYQELEDPRQALLGFRRSLTLSKEGFDDAAGDQEPTERAHRLRRAAEMCEKLDHDEEAADYWGESIGLLERSAENSQRDFADAGSSDHGDGDEEQSRRDEMVRAHRHLGQIYERRQRPAAAASHFRRILEIRYSDDQARQWLEDHLRRAGRPEELIELYDELLEQAQSDVERLELIEKLGDLYAGLGLPEDAQQSYRQALQIDPTRHEVRQKLVDLLSEHGRYKTLRDALNTVLMRTRDRKVHHEISMQLGSANEAMGDLDRAGRCYLEAVNLRAGDRQALESACRVLEQYVEERGARSEAPLGSAPAGKLLEKMLIRLAEVVPGAEQEREVLLKVAMMADERGDSAAASEARERAQALASTVDHEQGDSFRDVDARLDAMLDDLGELGDDEPSETGRPTHRKQRKTPQKVGGLELPKPGSKKNKKQSPTGLPRPASASTSDSPDQDRDDKEPDELKSFRRRFASMKKRPSQLPDADDVAQSPSLSKQMESRAKEDQSFKDREAPDTLQMPADQFHSLREESEEEIVDDSQETSASHKSGWSVNFSSSDEGGSEASEDTSPNIKPVEIAMSALDEARNSGDERQLAEAIDNVVTLAENTESELLEPAKLKSLSKEAGELFYYELEDEEAALPYLERVRNLDPDGEGSSAGVVNALEAIYEARGDVGPRVALLKQRLAAADSEEMKTTYRLLLAQVYWDQNDDEKQARRWLDEVLENEKEHEAAHRLLAEMARERQDWQEVADHLQVVVRAGGGGIDAVESERQLAEVLLHKLDEPRRAKTHFERVLKEAPGDSQALEGIKQSQANCEDWQGYVESLGRELGLLTGTPTGLSVDEIVELDISSVASAVRVPASQIVADAAHIVEEELADTEVARRLWGVTYRLWPEQVEALERRIELDRSAGADSDLASDLESYAAMVLDAHERFEALVEAAKIRAEILDDPQGARPLYTEAIALVGDGEEPPEGLDAARRALRALAH